MKAIIVDPPGKTADSLRLADVPGPAAERRGGTASRARQCAESGGHDAAGWATTRRSMAPRRSLDSSWPARWLRLAHRFRELSVGDRVYGLSGGGGYAELATLHQSLAMPIPDELTYHEAASIPEVFFTANTAVRTLGETLPGERILIHAGGSGVGIAAIQIARLIGAEVWITAGSEEKCERARELGADMTINYREQDFRRSGAGTDRRQGRERHSRRDWSRLLGEESALAVDGGPAGPRRIDGRCGG